MTCTTHATSRDGAPAAVAREPDHDGHAGDLVGKRDGVTASRERLRKRRSQRPVDCERSHRGDERGLIRSAVRNRDDRGAAEGRSGYPAIKASRARLHPESEGVRDGRIRPGDRSAGYREGGSVGNDARSDESIRARRDEELPLRGDGAGRELQARRAVKEDVVELCRRGLIGVRDGRCGQQAP